MHQGKGSIVAKFWICFPTGRHFHRLQKTGVDRAMGQHNTSDLSKHAEVHYKVGDWVIVHYLDEYDDNKYPGKVTAVFENEIKVSVLHKSGGYFKWPKKKDEVHYSLESVVANIDPPTVAGSEGQFTQFIVLQKLI